MKTTDSCQSASRANPTSDFYELLKAARLGESEAIGRLLQWYGDYLGVLANRNLDRRLRRRVNPSDIVQEAMLAAHRDFAAFRGQTQAELLCWLRTILIHVLHRTFARHVQVEKRDMRREVPLDAVAGSDSRQLPAAGRVLYAATDSPSADLLAKESELELAQRLARLKPAYADVIRMRIIQGMPFHEIASAMNRTSGAVRMLWLRALDALRKEDA